MPAFIPHPQNITALWPVLISRPAEGRRLSCCVSVQMNVLKALLVKYGKDLNSWLSRDQRNELLNVLREAFLDTCQSEVERQHRRDMLLMIELLASSFQLPTDASQIHRFSF